jgi:hypothetical protein
LNLLVPHHAGLGAQRRGMRFLTEFAINTRYPGDNATKRESQGALRRAGQVRDACRQLLKIKTLGRRKSR